MRIIVFYHKMSARDQIQGIKLKLYLITGIEGRRPESFASLGLLIYLL
jgi:hypothetical protein